MISGEQRAITCGHQICQVLDRLERIPVIFSSDPRTADRQRQDAQIYLEAGKTFKSLLRRYQSPATEKLLLDLSRKITGFRYRVEAIHGGLDPEKVDREQLRHLSVLAARWKRDQPLNPNKRLIERDLKRILEACRYPKFVRLLLKDAELREAFFNWIIRDNNEGRPFIEFPSICSQLEQSFLAIRLGRFGEKILAFEKISQNPHTAVKKVIQLPFFNGEQTKRTSILDEDRIVWLNGNWQLPIKKVLEVFKNKNDEPGNLEFFGVNGIMNWNSHEHGNWNALTHDYERIDLTQPEWWKQLPPYEYLDREQIEMRYGVSPNQEEWVVAAAGSRQRLTLDLEDSHGYLEIVMPVGEGCYRLFVFGKFSALYPHGVWEALTFLTDTVAGRIAYPDENPFYSRRQQAKFPLRMTPEEGKSLMDQIRRDMIHARGNNVVFQFAGENCAFWVQSLLQRLAVDRVPNLYKVHLLETNPSNPLLGKVFDWLRYIPKKWQNPAIKVFDRCLGSNRKLAVTEEGEQKFKSLRTTPSRDEASIFVPGLLNKLIEEGQLQGIVSFGHFFN
jgi:hypothetical protein